MAEHRAEIEAIAAGPWPPTFADTIEGLERSGTRLHLAERLLEDASGARSTEAVRALEAEMLPRLAAHRDTVGQDPLVFARIVDLVQRRGSLGLDAEQERVLDRYHRDIVRAGAALGAGNQARLREVNERLSALSAQFRRNLLEETRALAVRVRTADELDGLPTSMLEAAARAAEGDGFLLPLSLPSAQPALEFLHDRALRERLYRASAARGRRGGEHDNRATVAEIAALRAERDRHEAALQADGHAGPLEPWDWPYYAARERRERHAVDETRLQSYFELERVMRDGVFGIAERLYGLSFTDLDGAPRPDPDTRVWAVADADGRERGSLYLDPYARDGKIGGGWLDAYADPAPLLGRLPLVSIKLNITRPAEGAPALLTPLDVRILFHEFGHALHVLLSDVSYPRVAGLNVPDDVVEFPSKFHEALAFEPDVLARYARHHETGEALGEPDVAALGAATRDSAAFWTAQGVANALLDQAWHGLAPGETVAPEGVDAFEEAVLDRHDPNLRAVGFNYRSSFFRHVFDGPYAGTQYSYLWSGVLEATARQWLSEQGGITRAAGDRLRRELLSRGGVVDPIEAFKTITGREPSVRPFLEQRGLI